MRLLVSATLALSLLSACGDKEPVDSAPQDSDSDSDSDNDSDSDSDSDRDGYALEEDCDDTDPAVHPGAKEVPDDGVDNDCDPATLDDDLDGDGYAANNDCDDTDPLAWWDTVDSFWNTDAKIEEYCLGYCERTVIGDLVLENLSDLSSLRCLTKVRGNAILRYNDALTSLSGLEGLTSVGGNLEINQNSSLTSLSGLTAVALQLDPACTHRSTM